jgi:hypothetical protein
LFTNAFVVSFLGVTKTNRKKAYALKIGQERTE